MDTLIELDNFDVIEIKAKSNLYHVTPLNIPDNYEEYEWLKDLPNDLEYTYDPTNPMFFGLSEFSTIYFGGHNSARLRFKTIRPLKLLNIDEHKGYGNYYSHLQLVKDLKLDGWTAKDDINDNFYEIMLVNPITNIKLVERYENIPSGWELNTHEYPSKIDQAYLKRITFNQYTLPNNI